MRLTLCGSRKFEAKFHEWSRSLSFAGHVVYSLSVYSYLAENSDLSLDEKLQLDRVHFAKIDNSDGIVVLNVTGYIGESTKNEIAWARMKQKRIFWLEVPANGVPMADDLASELI
jgi:hypothetical protein